jgi:hypothetical protein
MKPQNVIAFPRHDFISDLHSQTACTVYRFVGERLSLKAPRET